VARSGRGGVPSYSKLLPFRPSTSSLISSRLGSFPSLRLHSASVPGTTLGPERDRLFRCRNTIASMRHADRRVRRSLTSRPDALKSLSQLAEVGCEARAAMAIR